MKEIPEGYIDVRYLPDGRIMSIMPLTFGRARICSSRDWSSIDENW